MNNRPWLEDYYVNAGCLGVQDMLATTAIAPSIRLSTPADIRIPARRQASIAASIASGTSGALSFSGIPSVPSAAASLPILSTTSRRTEVIADCSGPLRTGKLSVLSVMDASRGAKCEADRKFQQVMRNQRDKGSPKTWAKRLTRPRESNFCVSETNRGGYPSVEG